MKQRNYRKAISYLESLLSAYKSNGTICDYELNYYVDETEEFARLNGYSIKKVSPEKLTDIIRKGSGDLGDEILVTKKDIHYL